MGYWVARKRIKIKRGKSYVELKGGDPVPEAAFWPTRTACERMGLIQYVNRPEPITEAVAVPIEELPPREAFPRSQTARRLKTSDKRKQSKKDAEREKKAKEELKEKKEEPKKETPKKKKRGGGRKKRAES